MRPAAARAAGVKASVDEQCGLATHAQLAERGVTLGFIRSQIAAGRWQALSRSVIACHNGPLSDEQRLWFAVLDGGEGCALTGLSVLECSGLSGFAPERIQTAVPPTGSCRRTELYVRRRSRLVVADNVHPARTPPQLRFGPALIDAVQHMPSPVRGGALLAAVVQQRLLSPSALRQLLEAATTLPRRRSFVQIAGDIEGGAQSLLEIDFRRIALRAGLPPPTAQVVRRDSHGRRRYLDAEFDGFAVEVDGAVHLRPLSWWDDMWRQNEIVLAGTPVIRFASVGVRLQPERVVEQLRRAARRFGR